MSEVVNSAVALGTEIDLDVREGRFQPWLSLMAGMSSVLAGFEVSYEHYRGSYSRRVMYTPVILSVALAAGGISGFFSKRAARTVLRGISVVTLGDSVIGFYFHLRGVHRKPGGWRLAASHREHGDGATDLRSSAIRCQRLPWSCRFVSTA